MIIKASVYIIENLLRDDIRENLGRDGIEALIEWYDACGEETEFDQSLFWVWSRYSSATEAVTDINSSVVEEIVNDIEDELEDGEEVDEDDVEAECNEWLSERTDVITLDNGDVLVYNEF